MLILKELCTRASTCHSQGTRVWRVGVPVIITDVFGDVVACQLGNNVGNVAERAEVLQPLVSTALWRKTCITTNTKTAATSPAPTSNLTSTYIFQILF